MLVALVLVMALWNVIGTGGGLIGSQKPIQLDVTQLMAKADANEIESAKWSSTQVTGTFKGEKREPFYCNIPPEGSPMNQVILNKLLDNKVPVEYTGPPASTTVFNILGFLAVPIMIGLMIWLLFLRPMQMGGNQAMSFGRSRAKRVSETTPKITFEDVAGIDEAKEELYEIVDFLKNTKKYTALGAKIPKGILLTGPPGVGKTHLARAIAGEAGVPFFHISGSDFVEMFVGVGAARVRDLFETAKAHRPSLIFIDEIDAVGRQRGAGLGGGHDEREQTLNQLLVEMDGFDPNSGVILIAATNRPDVLDPALLRPGRFDRHIIVDVPDAPGREAILKIHAKGKPLDGSIDLNAVARRTPGFTGADLANMLNEGALLAARRNHAKIRQMDLEDALDRTIAGPEKKSRIISSEERSIIANHEAGHALVGELLENTDPVHKVTILPRGMSLGSTWQLPETDKHLISKQRLLDEITALLAGRVAEELVYGEVTTGASNDLERVTRIARAMICEYGMSDKLGTLAIGKRGHNPFLGRDYTLDERNYSEDVAKLIDEEVRAIVDRCHSIARDMLTINREKLDAVVKALLERETLDREEFLAVLEGKPLPEKRSVSNQPELDLESDKETPKAGKSVPKPQFEPGTANA